MRARTLRQLLGLMRPFAGWVALSVALGSATVVSAMGLLGTSAHLIAAAALQPSVAELQVAIVGVRFFGITRGVFRYLERLVSHGVNLRLLAALRTRLYRSLEPLAPAGLGQVQSGDLLSRAVGDIETLENFFVRGLAPVLTAGVVTLGAAVFVGRYDASLGSVLVIGLALSGVGVPWLARRMQAAAGRQVVDARADYRTAWVETLQGLGDLLAFGRGADRLELLTASQARLEAHQRRLAEGNARMNAVNLMINQFTLWAVLAAALPLMEAGRVDGIGLAVLSLVTLASFEAVLPLGTAAQQLESSLRAGERVFALEDVPPVVPDPAQPAAPALVADLSLRGLGFRYPGSAEWALRELSLELPQGRRIAVMGASGSGKTSLLRLLLRLWDAPPGQIFWNGVEIHAYRAEDVRRLFSVVTQDTYLFSASVRQNLLLARPGASEAELLEAVRQARLEPWLAGLPEGLDTWIGEHGRQMSGGERQRLAVCRAILRDAPVWLLDEPTAHLDAKNERALIETVMERTQGKSLVWVTHRLTGLEHMDEILVLDGGRAAERGTAAALTAAGGLYARMAALQRASFPMEEGTFSDGEPS